MDSLQIERFSLVGNSFGAAIALRVAVLHPKRIASLILFSVGSVPEPDPSAVLLAAWNAEEEALSAGDAEGAVDAVISAWVSPGASDEVRTRVAAMQRRNYELHASEQELEQAPDPLEEEPTLLSRVDCPVLLAVGEDDMVDFVNAASELAPKMPSATTALIAGCGHLPPLEAPEEFRRLVLETVSRGDF
jgi:pimeloyl-ACP methyl ester carboxylesterase